MATHGTGPSWRRSADKSHIRLPFFSHVSCTNLMKSVSYVTKDQDPFLKMDVIGSKITLKSADFEKFQIF